MIWIIISTQMPTYEAETFCKHQIFIQYVLEQIDLSEA